MGKIRQIILFIVFLLGTVPGFSQELGNDYTNEVETRPNEGKEELAEFIQKAQYQKAIEYIDLQEATKELLYQKAFCYKSLNNYSKAIEILESLKESEPGDIPVQLELALCYEWNLQYPKSIACYENLIELDPDNTYFQVRKADLIYRSEKYTAALEEYFKIDPEQYNPGYLKKSIAMCYDKINQTDSAQVYFAEAWKLNPGDTFSAVSLVKMAVQQEDYVSALQYSEDFIKKDSTNAQMNVLNAYVFYNLDAYEEAVKRFEKCRLAGDSSLMVNRSLGISHFFLQNDSLAYPYLQQAYAQDTINMTVLYALASVNYNLSYFPDAIQDYTKLVEYASPQNHKLYTYHTGLAKSLEKDSLFQEAAQNYTMALRYASSNNQKMEALYALAVVLEFDLKAYQPAVFYYTQYQATLLNYRDALSEEVPPDPAKIEEAELKMTELEKHIRALKEKYEIDYKDKIWSH
jgi:tetratricopeptide (TPR) repeat protein